MSWLEGRGVTLPDDGGAVPRHVLVEGGAEHHRCHHVEQEPGEVDQAAGEVEVVVVDGLEAGHDDLKDRELDSALLADGDHVLLVDEHVHLCRRAELIRHTITGYRLVCRTLCCVDHWRSTTPHIYTISHLL